MTTENDARFAEVLSKLDSLPTKSFYLLMAAVLVFSVIGFFLAGLLLGF